MNYVELNIHVEDHMQSEILTAELALYPFDTFQSEGQVLKAYIPQDALADCKDHIDSILLRYSIADARYISIEAKNWNHEWESNFERVEIGSRLLIRAPFHPEDNTFEQQVVIMPKMSFGTGHHATTHLMAEMILELDLKGKCGLDMGSGTGVLSIIAAKAGAAKIDAVDIDTWADENCRENIVVNGVEERVNPILGTVEQVKGREYDFILANINRNIILDDMPSYAEALNGGGVILISGFVQDDIPSLSLYAENLGLTVIEERVRDGWAMILVEK